MTQMSSSNKLNRLSAVLRDSLIRYKGVLILYSALLLVTGPIFLTVDLNSRDGFYGLSTEVLFHFILLALSCILPLLLFSYINSRQAVDVYHSLPVTRGKLYWGNVLAGAVILLGPYLVLGLPCGAVAELCHDGDGMLQRVLRIALAGLALYSLMVFIMVNCGTLFESITYFGITQLGYPFFLMVLSSSLSRITFGWSGGYTTGFLGFLMRFSPCYVLFGLLTGSNAVWSSFWQLAVTILVTLVPGMVLYRKRRSESAGSSFAFRPLFYIAALLISITAGIGTWLLFEDIDLPIWVGVTVGVLGYFILDTIRNRGFSGIRETALVSVGAVVSVAMFFGVAALSGTFGYEQHLPVESGVRSVEVSWNVGSEEYLSQTFPMTDKDNISRVLKAHGQILDNQKAIEDYDWEARIGSELKDGYERYAFDDGSASPWQYGSCTVRLTYHMIDGRTVTRSYRNVPLALTRPLYEAAGSEAYRFLQWADLASTAASGAMQQLDFWQLDLTYGISDGRYMEMDSATAEKLAGEMVKDLQQRPGDWNTHPTSAPLGKMRLYPSYTNLTKRRKADLSSYTMNIYASDIHTLAFLKQLGIDLALGELFGEPESEGTVLSSDKEITYAEPEGMTCQVLLLTEKEYEARKRTGSPDCSFFHFAGQWADWDWRKENGGYAELPVGVVNTLLAASSDHYISKERRDVLVIDGQTYLVYPEYSEQVRKLLQSEAE